MSDEVVREVPRASRAELLRASPPLFQSAGLDRLTRVHPVVPPLIYGPAIAVLCVLALRDEPAAHLLLGVAGGYVFWTLVEYWAHRTVFHFEPEGGLGARLHWMIHGVHHDHPSDRLRLVLPPALSVPLAFVFLGLFVLVLRRADGLGRVRGVLRRISGLRHAPLRPPSPPAAEPPRPAPPRAAHAPSLRGRRAGLRRQRPVVGHGLPHLLEPRARGASPRRALKASLPPRILILTASVGAGHDQPARTLADQLRAEHVEVDVVTEDALSVMGRAVGAVSEDAATIVFYRFQWVWDVGFWLFTSPRVTRSGAQRLLTRLGAPGLLRLIAETRPDVIVSTYPERDRGARQAAARGPHRRPGVRGDHRPRGAALLGRRAAPTCTSSRTRSRLPRCAAWPVPRPQCTACTGSRDRSSSSRGRWSEARAALGLPLEGRIVLVSGGGWGVGDVEGAVDEALAIDGVSQVVSLCGHNDELRGRIARRFRMEPRVRVEGFTDKMPEWLAAVDVLVHSTGGLTVLEALMRGCPAISYGWGRGHVRVNNRAFRRYGLARVVSTRGDLGSALRSTLSAPRRIDPRFAALPSAASFVLALAGIVG